MASNQEIGARLAEARVAAGLSIGQAALLMGMTIEKLEALESGAEHAYALTVINLSALYHVGMDWIEGTWTEANLPPSTVAMVKDLKEPDRSKILHTLTMIGGHK